jgi:hypothetical protein
MAHAEARSRTHGGNQLIPFEFERRFVHKCMVRYEGEPSPQGLYDPRFEHDACGVGFVVHIKGVRSHTIVRKALQVLINLLHRGACGCEANTGDGAGILIRCRRVPAGSHGRWAFACRRARATAPGSCSCRTMPTCAPRSSRAVRAIVARKGSACSAGATCRRPTGARAERGGGRAGVPAVVHRPRAGLRSLGSVEGDALRAQALRHPQARSSTSRRVRDPDAARAFYVVSLSRAR